MINAAHAQGVRVVLCITNFSGSDIDAIVSNEVNRTRFIQQTLAIVSAAEGDGINIDFEGVLNSSRSALTTFMHALADSFHTRIPGSHVSCAPADFDLRSSGGDWDLAGINPWVDMFFIQCYGYHYGGSSTSGPIALLPNTSFWGSVNITTLIDNVVLARIDTGNVVMGLPHYGYRWPTQTEAAKSPTLGSGVAFYYPDALSYIASYGRQWDAIGLNPWFRYQSGSQWYQGWYDDPESMSHKYAFALSRGLKGIGMWALGQDNGNHDIWDVIAEYFIDSTLILPLAPVLEQPPPFAEDVSLNPVLSWIPSTPSLLSRVQVARDDQCADLVSDDSVATLLSLQVGPLEYHRPYFWRVRSINEAGAGVWSEIRQFTTVAGLSVDLASFTAEGVGPQSVLLQWTTLSETVNLGFDVQRKLGPVFRTLEGSAIAGHGTTTEPHDYAFLDTTAMPGSLVYRLAQTDSDYTVHYSEPVAVVVTSVSPGERVGASFALEQNYPNPFNPATTISFSVPTAGRAILMVYDLLGREVVRLYEGQVMAGGHRIIWNALSVPSGTYFCRLRFEGRSATRMITVVK